MNASGVITGLILLVTGIFSICGAAFDWDWFIESRKARFFVSMFGRNCARVFYAILGVVIAVMGVLMALGLISAERKRKRFGLSESNVEARFQMAATPPRPICRQAAMARSGADLTPHPSSFILPLS